MCVHIYIHSIFHARNLLLSCVAFSNFSLRKISLKKKLEDWFFERNFLSYHILSFNFLFFKNFDFVSYKTYTKFSLRFL